MVLGGKREALGGIGDDVFCGVARVWDYLLGGFLS